MPLADADEAWEEEELPAVDKVWEVIIAELPVAEELRRGSKYSFIGVSN